MDKTQCYLHEIWVDANTEIAYRKEQKFSLKNGKLEQTWSLIHIVKLTLTTCWGPVVGAKGKKWDF